MREIIIKFWMYLGINRTCEEYDLFSAERMANVTIFLWVVWILCRFAVGLEEANNPKECEVRSIIRTVIVLPYATGCFLAKDRFLLKFN